MTDLADKLAAAAQAAIGLRAAEADVDRARENFREALRAARAAGASYGLIGRMVALSRQRVAHRRRRLAKHCVSARNSVDRVTIEDQTPSADDFIAGRKKALLSSRRSSRTRGRAP
jgi:hypothetical protein